MTDHDLSLTKKIDVVSTRLILNNLFGVYEGDNCNKPINPLAHTTFKQLSKNYNYSTHGNYIPVELIYRILSEMLKVIEKNDITKF